MRAAWNHTNIAAIYGIEESNAVSAIVMELVAGETLEETLRHQPSQGLPVDEALAINEHAADQP